MRPNKIQLLSSQVVDQIAAGEVVERPSHMLKELIENSIDAGASEIEVQYSDGGRNVKVIDNGYGIAKEDLNLALARHGTSKIRISDDLWNLNSFGFRGEALASIAAVSDLNLISRPRDLDSAYKVTANFGKILSPEICGGGFGTQIQIQNLFENTPARLKFLKSAGAESSQIKTMFKALAMAHPQVTFRLEENGSLIFYFRASTAIERVSDVLGLKFYSGEAQRESVHVQSYFTDPHTVQKTSRNLWIYVQNRWIQDRSLIVAILESYRSLLMHGEYPSAVVFVNLDPTLVDVNIHPTKSQVKFQNPSEIFRCVQTSLRNSLEQAPWRGVNELSSFKEHSVVKTQDSQSTHNFSFSDQSLNVTHYKQKSFDLSQNAPKFQIEIARTESDHREKIFNTKAIQDENKNDQIDIGKSYWSTLQVLGQADLTYIVCQNNNGFVFVDQHAAHERVVFEKLMLAWNSKKIDVQELLIPLVLDFPPEKLEALLSESKHLKQLGLEVEAFGPQSLAIKSIPSLIKEVALAKALEKMADEIFEHGGSFKIEKLIIDLCATIACHSVVRAGQSLSSEQMKSLLLQMDEFPLSSFCPHGRPVSVEYAFQKLEKDFGRTL